MCVVCVEGCDGERRDEFVNDTVSWPFGLFVRLMKKVEDQKKDQGEICGSNSV